jgi:hypothetical protein
VGRFVHKDFRSQGIGHSMNLIMYQAVWQSGFRAFATISQDNDLVMQSHKNNPYLQIRKQFPDNYLLVEFVKSIGA